MGFGDGFGEGSGWGGGQAESKKPVTNAPSKASGAAKPTSGGGGERGTDDWKVDLFDVAKDMKVFMCSFCGCWSCMAYKIADGIGENGCVWFCIMCCAPILSGILRKKVREHFSIKGELLEDILWACICCPCAFLSNGQRADRARRQGHLGAVTLYPTQSNKQV